MKKYSLDFTVAQTVQLNAKTVQLILDAPGKLPQCLPGQFVEARIDNTPAVLLRRPISINYADYETNQLWLVVQSVGAGSAHLAALKPGDTLNLLLPLGNGFSLPQKGECDEVLLVGGGVGSAPLLYLGAQLSERGCRVTYLLGGRSNSDITQQQLFAAQGTLCLTTEDASAGERGFVTQHSVLQQKRFDRIYVCGPKPMMQAVVKYARQHEAWCEVSLENKMACGLGACLCCVEKTTEGHKCVCSDGPVFKEEDLLWQD